MSDFRRNGHTIQLKINDCIWYVHHVSRHTTSREIIQTLFKYISSGKGNNSDTYAIYESSQGIERLLPDKTRILKVMQSWKSDNSYELVLRKNNVHFEVPTFSKARRKKFIGKNGRHYANRLKQDLNFVKYSNAPFDPTIRVATCIKTRRDCKENPIEGPYLTINHDQQMPSFNIITKSDFNGVSRGRLPGQSEATEEGHVCDIYATKAVTDVKYAARKQLKTKISRALVNIPKTGNAGFPTNTDSTITVVKRNRQADIYKTPRRFLLKRHQQLANRIETKMARFGQKEEKNALLEKYFADYITYCSPNQVIDSEFRQRGDGAETVFEANCFTSYHCKVNSQNFSKNICHSNDENEMDISHGDKLNTAFIVEEKCNIFVGKLVDYSISDEEETILADIHEIDTVSELAENARSHSNIVQSVFSLAKNDDEDNAMESFMKSTLCLCEECFDECSIACDDGKEVMV